MLAGLKQLSSFGVTLCFGHTATNAASVLSAKQKRDHCLQHGSCILFLMGSMGLCSGSSCWNEVPQYLPRRCAGDTDKSALFC